MDVSKRKVISILIIFLALILGITTETGFSLGDKLFLGLGISPWSNGRTGFHLTIIVTFTLFIIGILEAKRAMPGRQIILVVIFLIMISPNVLTLVKPIYFGMQSGLAAVEYDSRNTHFKFIRTEDKKNIKMIGAVSLTNYGDNPINISIKIPSEGREDWLSSDFILTGVQDTMESGIFILPPGEQTILTYSEIPLTNDINGAGSMSGPDLILFTDKEIRMVGSNL